MNLNLDGAAHLDTGQLITHGPDARQSLGLIAIDVLHSRPEDCTRIHARLV